MQRHVLSALLPVALSAFACAACFALYGSGTLGATLAVGTGALVLLLVARAHWMLSDIFQRLDLFRMALSRAFAGSADLGPLPEGDDDVGHMGRVLRAGHRQLLEAWDEVSRLSTELGDSDRQHNALATFGTLATGTTDPDTVWPAFGRALRVLCGQGCGYRVLLPDPDTGGLRAAAEEGPPPGEGGVLELLVPGTGTQAGLLQLRLPDASPRTRAIAGAMASQAALAWTRCIQWHQGQPDAETDPLTGLHNLNWFRHRAALLHERARLGRRVYSIGIVDVDRLQVINEQFGRSSGDVVLCAVAAALRTCCRAGDGLARAEGGQFLLLFPETSLPEAVATAELVRRQVCGARVAHDGHPLPVTVSVGCGAWPLDDSSWEDVRAIAATALYRAKLSGRNRVEAVAAPW